MEIDEFERAKRFRVYKNGDKYFPGVLVTLNKRRTANLGKLLDLLTQQVQANEAVRKLCTPRNGTRVRSLNDIADEGVYVAVGNTKFKKLGYTNIGREERHRYNKSEAQQTPFLNSYHYSSKRLLDPLKAVSIRVYANGKEFESEKRIVLSKHMLQSMEVVLNEISTRVQLISGVAKSLYTLDGTRVERPDELESGQIYVAVGSELGGYQKLDYGRRKPQFNLSPKLPRRRNLQPLSNVSANSSKKSSSTGRSIEDESDFYKTDSWYKSENEDIGNNKKNKHRKIPKHEIEDDDLNVDENYNSELMEENDDIFRGRTNAKRNNHQGMKFGEDNDNVYRSKRATKGTEGARTVAELQESPTDTNADHQDKAHNQRHKKETRKVTKTVSTVESKVKQNQYTKAHEARQGLNSTEDDYELRASKYDGSRAIENSKNKVTNSSYEQNSLQKFESPQPDVAITSSPNEFNNRSRHTINHDGDSFRQNDQQERDQSPENDAEHIYSSHNDEKKSNEQRNLESQDNDKNESRYNERRHQSSQSDGGRPSYQPPQNEDRFQASPPNDKPKSHQSDRAQSPHHNDRAQSPQYDDRAQSPQNDDGAQTPRNDDRAQSPQNDDRAQSPQNDDRAQSPQNDDRVQSPQNDDRAQSPQNDDRAQSSQHDDYDQPSIHDKGPVSRTHSQNDDATNEDGIINQLRQGDETRADQTPRESSNLGSGWLTSNKRNEDEEDQNRELEM